MKKYISILLISLATFSCENSDNSNEINESDLNNIIQEEVSYATVAPFYPIDFEEEGFGADWTWTVFENGSNSNLEIVDNPDKTAVNTSNKVAKFTAQSTGAQWAGVESKHGTDIGSFTFDNTNTVVKMLVYKSVISDVGLKFAEVSNEAQPEVKVANTKINEWEELVFDVSGNVGKGVTGIIDQIIIFPDFRDRSSNQVIYIDRITFESKDNQ